jgi:radical SAM superfamily enzyme YgiQ (UPF0313 family)
MLKEHGIITVFYMMYGCPQDTRESITNSVNLLRETGPILVSWSPFLPLPRTELTLQIERESHYSGKMWLKGLSRKYNKWQVRRILSMALSDYLIIRFGWIKQLAKFKRGYILNIFSPIWRYYPLKECIRGRILAAYLFSKFILSRSENSINIRE